MIIPVLLLLSASRCASADACPSVDELRRAYLNRLEASLAIREEEANAAAEPDRIISLRPLPIRRISNVYCGEPYAETGEVACRFTVVHRSGRSHRIGILTRGTHGWEMLDELGVWEPRRARR
jgi:hypothetical protein